MTTMDAELFEDIIETLGRAWDEETNPWSPSGTAAPSVPGVTIFHPIEQLHRAEKWMIYCLMTMQTGYVGQTTCLHDIGYEKGTSLGIQDAEFKIGIEQDIAAYMPPLSREKAEVQEERSQSDMAVPGDEMSDWELEEQEIELDYSAMDARSRIEVPAKVNWKNVSISKRLYSEIFNIKYELDVEEEL